jgi:hypothetical protein
MTQDSKGDNLSLETRLQFAKAINNSIKEKDAATALSLIESLPAGIPRDPFYASIVYLSVIELAKLKTDCGEEMYKRVTEVVDPVIKYCKNLCKYYKK